MNRLKEFITRIHCFDPILFFKHLWSSPLKLLFCRSILIYLGITLSTLSFVVAIHQNEQETYFRSIQINNFAFVAKHDTIRLANAMTSTLNIKDSEKGAYVQAIDHFYRMQGIQKTTEELNKYYEIEDLANFYKEDVGEKWDKSWLNMNELLFKTQEKIDRMKNLQFFLFWFLILTQLLMLLFELRRDQLMENHFV